MDGMFVAAGPDIQNGLVENIQLYDIAPTVLHLLEIPTPSNIDGQVRTDVISAEYLASHPVSVQSESPQASTEAVGQTRDMTQEEQDYYTRTIPEELTPNFVQDHYWGQWQYAKRDLEGTMPP